MREAKRSLGSQRSFQDLSEIEAPTPLGCLLLGEKCSAMLHMLEVAAPEGLPRQDRDGEPPIHLGRGDCTLRAGPPPKAPNSPHDR